MHETAIRVEKELIENDQRWADLARHAGVTLQVVQNWKARGIPKHALQKVSGFLGRSIDWILTGEEVDVFKLMEEHAGRKERRPRDAHLTDAEVYRRNREIEQRLEDEEETRRLLADGTIEASLELEAEERGILPPEHREHELEFVGRLDAWDSNTPLDDDEVELPLFREVELAAGAGQTEVVENRGAKLRFAKSTLSRAGVMKENAACAFVRGNSMDPVMPNGTCVGVNTGDTTVRDGEVYAIDHDGMLRVKYLHRRPGGGIKIVSQNAIEHEPEDFSAQRVAEENIRIIGRVFWWSVLR